MSLDRVFDTEFPRPFTPALTGYSGKSVSGWQNTTYNYTLSNEVESGEEFLFNGNYTTSGPTITAMEAGGFGFRPGYSFPANDINPGVAVISATLTYTVTSVTTATTLGIALDTPRVTNEAWRTGAGPVSVVASGGALTGQAGTVGEHSVDITAQLQSVINHANYSAGDYINIAFEAEVTAGTLSLGGVGTSLQTDPPRLVVVMGVQEVQFDTTSSYLHKGTNLTGIPAAFGAFTLSAWLSAKGAAAQNVIGANENSFALVSFSFARAANKSIQASGRNNLLAFSVNAQPSTGAELTETEGLHHFLIIADRAASPASDRIKAYKDGVLVANEDWADATTDIDGNILIDWFIGAHENPGAPPNAAGGHYEGTMGAVWFDTTVTGISVSDFIDASGRPVDLGTDGSRPTGTKPLIYFDGDAATWSTGTNLGSGGSFTKYGTISDG